VLIFRWLILLLLLAAGISFALYIVTGQVRFKNNGLLILKWTMLAGFAFFAVLIMERIG